MANGLSKSRWSTWRALGLACALGAAMVASPRAQTVPATEIKSGLYSVPPAHFLVATVVETGSPTVPAEVRIEFRDALDQRRGSASGILTRGKPVRLRVQMAAGAGVQQLRAILQLTDGVGSEPIVTLEDLDANSLVVETKPPHVPPSVGGGAEANCGGWRVTRITIGPTVN